jgi:outer membrane protein OmpA-like peptidoglycan-associated protein
MYELGRSLMSMGGLWRGLQVAALVAFLAGCGLFGGGKDKPAGDFPNLGTVPNEAPKTSTTAERQVIASGLLADRQNAGYSDQPLTAQPAAKGNGPAPVPKVQPMAQAAPATTTPTAATPTVPTATAPAATASAVAPAEPAAPEPVAPQPPAPEPTVTSLAPPPNPAPPASTMTQTTAAAAPAQPSAQAAPAAAGGEQPIALVYFADASTKLSGHDLTVLREVVSLQQQQGGQLRVVGHSSQAGGSGDPAAQDETNYKLSLARANAVAEALTRMGVQAGAMTVAAVGSQAPHYEESTPTGEAGNRRVEIFLVR